jgi:lysylphosphatidylglycerol synthetase-like protein (DUF2156 family)
MEFLENILFGLNAPNDYLELLLQFLVLTLLSCLVFYIGYLLFTKGVFAKPKYPRDYQLKINVLWAIIFTVVIFSVYLFFLIKRNGTDLFLVDNVGSLIRILPVLLLFLTFIFIFLNRYYSFINALKRK